eukprot:TRINITY_DN17027_c0_g1_i1.p1 TRINITY_DN17027_c0_g1~~TRINITY_DN17027_c0_g1_i1.p1  ORF type:complete len:326 (+),score=41.21 TRINITY_DN17027_c0_g1_i1:157-1134(+)
MIGRRGAPGEPRCLTPHAHSVVALTVLCLLLCANSVSGRLNERQPILPESISTSATSQPSEVIVLTETTIYHSISKGQWLLEFYSPTCPHCLAFALTWEEAAVDLKGTFQVAKIDAVKYRSLGQDFGVRGVPSLFLIADGRSLHYKSTKAEDLKRDVLIGKLEHGEPLGSFVPIPKMPPIDTLGSIILTEHTFDMEIANGVWLVNFYSPSCVHCQALEGVWQTLAQDMAGTAYHIASVDGKAESALMHRIEYDGYPAILRISGGKYHVYPKDAHRSARRFKLFLEDAHADRPALKLASQEDIAQRHAAFTERIESFGTHRQALLH